MHTIKLDSEMYKKVTAFEHKMDEIKEGILGLDLDIKKNPEILSGIKSLQAEISHLERSSSSIVKDVQKQIVAELKFFSSCLKTDIYHVFSQYTEEYVLGRDAFLNISIKRVWSLGEGSDEKASDLFRMYTIFWGFLEDMYVSSDPEVFVELCKKNTVLSDEQVLSLLTSLVDKFVFTIIKDILEEVADRDDETKADLPHVLRNEYPRASKSVDHILFSKNKRNALQQDFLIALRQDLSHTLQETFAQNSYLTFYQHINRLSLHALPIAREDWIDDMFSEYVSMFLKNQFQLSHSKKVSQQDQKKTSGQAKITSLFLSGPESSLKLKELPDGLKIAIDQYLSVKKLNGSCEKFSHGIVKILQKILTKNEAVRKQWFVKKIASYGSRCIDDDFFVLLEKYGFSCVDEDLLVGEKSDDIPQRGSLKDNKDSLNDSDIKEPLSDPKKKILLALDALDTLERLDGQSKKDNLTKKISGYADIFEELHYAFDNKAKFIESAVSYCYSNPRLDNDIKKVIYGIVAHNKQEEHKDGRNYYIFPMTKGWRIILHKKGVIGTIRSHDHYERYLKNNY